jgi:uncharacterized protein YuzE
MKIAYSPDADVLTIQLRQGKPADSRDLAEGIIVHFSAKGEPLEIEILDASKVVQKKDIEISLGLPYGSARQWPGQDSSSSNALASWRSAVSKPSVNQP